MKCLFILSIRRSFVKGFLHFDGKSQVERPKGRVWRQRPARSPRGKYGVRLDTGAPPLLQYKKATGRKGFEGGKKGGDRPRDKIHPICGVGGHHTDPVLYLTHRVYAPSVLAALSDIARFVRRVEFHIQSPLYLQVGGERPHRDAEGPRLLLRLHAGEHSPRTLPRGEGGVERLSRRGDKHDIELRDRVPVPALPRFRQDDRHQRGGGEGKGIQGRNKGLCRRGSHP